MKMPDVPGIEKDECFVYNTVAYRTYAEAVDARRLDQLMRFLQQSEFCIYGEIKCTPSELADLLVKTFDLVPLGK